MSNKPPFRDPKYSGWPGPEPVQVAEPEQTDIEDAVAAAPKKRKPKAVDAE
jgi:hypothetical protein